MLRVTAMSNKQRILRLPTEIQIQGKRHKVESWRYQNEVLVKMAEILYKKHGQRFLDLLLSTKVKNTKHPYASCNANELRRAVKVQQTCVYLETDLNERQARIRVKKVLKLMGYSSTDLEYL